MAIRNRSKKVMCEECGATVPSDSRFCNVCGAEIHIKRKRVELRDDYAQRVFTLGCLGTTFVAVTVGLIVSAFSPPLGVATVAGVVIAGLIFMRLLFGNRPT